MLIHISLGKISGHSGYYQRGIADKLAMSTQSCILDQAELIVKWWNTITMWVDKVGKEEVQLTHGYIDVVRVDAQVGMQTIGGLLQPFTIGGF